MLAGSALITASSLSYFDFETLPPFVIEKLPLRFEALWLFSLRVHVASAALAFPLCLALSTRVLQRHRRVHRWLGRVAGVLVLGVLVPSGAVLAFDAKGGSGVTVGFLLSGAIVAWGIVSGVLSARRRDLVAHRRAMSHVVAQMSVAVVSRAMIVGFDALGMEPELAYALALWLPVVASAAAVELVTFRHSLFDNPLLQRLQRIRREIAQPVLVRSRAVARPFPRLGR
jgi:uncharacterized membrane protein YozB (DUF420 family)